MKLRIHHYICQKCGCGKVNFLDHRDNWATKYCLPDGTAKVLRLTPACEVGPKTQQYLDHYAKDIVDLAAAKASEKAAAKSTVSTCGARDISFPNSFCVERSGHEGDHHFREVP